MKDTMKNILGGTAIMIIGGIGTSIAVWGLMSNTETTKEGYYMVKNAVVNKVKSLKAKKD